MDPIPRRAGATTVLLLAALLHAGCGPADDSSGEGPYSVATVRAMDAAVRDGAGLLLVRQRANGSWEDDAAATALALQALSSVEPPVPSHAAAAERGLAYLFRREGRGDAETYALAYALAAVTVRPSMDDRSGLLGRGPSLRDGFQRALAKDCGGFQAAVLLNALGKAGLPKERLRELARRPAKRRAARDPACAGRLPDPGNEAVRGYVAAILAQDAGLAEPGAAKAAFDDIVGHEEYRKPYPSVPLGLTGLMWTSAGFREMRFMIVEPARGCYFSGDLLARRILDLRRRDGSWGSDLAAATALMGLVNLRRTFEKVVPYEKGR
ncbi:MAG: hypothetical protein HYX59_09265 [Elusimicrobia bacterium]|nr:hypothetical protein [Elusimicrobiota bacterium]